MYEGEKEQKQDHKDVLEDLLPVNPTRGAAQGGSSSGGSQPQVEVKPQQAGYSGEGILGAIVGAAAGAVKAVGGMFKRYEPEALNSRIADPTVLPSDGRNPAYLCMKIDGQVRNFRLPTSTETALANGSLPIEVLANTCLRKYDEGVHRAAVNYDMEQASTSRSVHVPSMHM